MPESTLEHSLSSLQTQIEASLDKANALTKRLKRLRASAQAGDLRDIDKSLPEVRDLAAAVKEQSETLEFGFDDKDYFPDVFLSDLVEASREQGMTVFAQDGKLYCYPLLLRVKTADRAVQIGKKMERGVRPSALAAKLRVLQARPARFKPADFLNLLYRAYRHCASADESAVLTLSEIYDVLTLMPGAAKEYTRDDFARDLYLVDKSGVSRMDNGMVFRFAASTGTRNAAATFLCIAEDGSEKRYYGISFEKSGKGGE